MQTASRLQSLVAVSLIAFVAVLASIDCNCESDVPVDECNTLVVACVGDLRATIGESVTLRGSAGVQTEAGGMCFYDQDPLVYSWSQFSGPGVTIEDPDRAVASFVPTQVGEYVFRFEAADPVKRKSKACTVRVAVTSVACDPPVADAEFDQAVYTVAVPVTVDLDGSGSRVTSQTDCDLALIEYAWTVLSEPRGSSVVISDADQAQAGVDLSVFGTYEFRLEVRDNGGADGRTDRDRDTVEIVLGEKTGCGDLLQVTVVEAATRDPVAGAHVTVVDASDAAHVRDTDANGVASFSTLAYGPRKSISVETDQTAPSLVGSGPDRPRFETTTLLDHCASKITVPLRYSGSGAAAVPTGRVVAKVPASMFYALPLWKCGGNCVTDADCDDTSFCQTTPGYPCGPNPPQKPSASCVLRDPVCILCPDPHPGQFRFVMLVPVLAGKNFTYGDLNKIFAPPTEQGDIWPPNLATDDYFLNGLGSSLGRDPWGATCVRNADCPTPEAPNTEDYICEEHVQSGERRCKDKSLLRNISISAPAGSGTRLALLAGIVDVSTGELMSILLPYLTGFPATPDAAAKLPTAFQMHTLHVCLLSVDVEANSEVDISPALGGLDELDCWNVDYQMADTVVAGYAPCYIHPGNACFSDADCSAGTRCWPDPRNPRSSYCMYPLAREEVVSNDAVTVRPNLTVFDPTAVNADERVCSWLPDTAPFEVMCPTGEACWYESCDPPDVRDLQVPPDAECSFPYGLTLAAFDVPAGHAKLPEGGRVFIGFDFNRTETHYRRDAEFLVPSEAMDGSVQLSVTQMYFRNLKRTDPGPFWEIPGYLAAQYKTSTPGATLYLPAMINVPALDPLPDDVGLSVNVAFEAEDPTVFPPTLKRAWAAAMGARMPTAGVHEMTYDLVETTLSGEELKGVVLSRVDYAAAITFVDPWWRVYMPVGTTVVALPSTSSPFASGDDVWIAPFGAAFEVSFDYDVFPADILMGPMSRYSQDSWAVIVP